MGERSKAKRCEAMQSDAKRSEAKRCEAMRSDAMRCEAKRCNAMPYLAHHLHLHRAGDNLHLDALAQALELLADVSRLVHRPHLHVVLEAPGPCGGDTMHVRGGGPGDGRSIAAAWLPGCSHVPLRRVVGVHPLVVAPQQRQMVPPAAARKVHLGVVRMDLKKRSTMTGIRVSVCLNGGGRRDFQAGRHAPPCPWGGRRPMRRWTAWTPRSAPRPCTANEGSAGAHVSEFNSLSLSLSLSHTH